MADISDLKRGTQHLKLDMSGNEVNIEYDPNAFTPEAESMIGEAADGQKGAALAKLTSSILVDWDLTSDGEPYPPTEENIFKMPLGIIVAIFVSLGEAVTEEVKAEGKA